MEDLQRRRLSILLFTGITLGWMILCYIAWVASGCKPFMPFISDFDLFEPGDTMFSLGTFLIGVDYLMRHRGFLLLGLLILLS